MIPFVSQKSLATMMYDSIMTLLHARHKESQNKPQDLNCRL